MPGHLLKFLEFCQSEKVGTLCRRNKTSSQFILQIGGQRMMEVYSEQLQMIEDKNELSKRCEQVTRALYVIHTVRVLSSNILQVLSITSVIISRVFL